MAEIETLDDREKEAMEELRRRLKDDLTPDTFEDNLLFYRFLKARGFNINKAENMLRKHIIWRRAVKVDTILKDFEPSEVFLKYIQGTYLGEDKEGCAVRYLPLGNIDARDVVDCFKLNEYLRNRLWVVEKDLAQMKESNEKTGRNASKIVCIVNLDKLQLSSVTHPSASTYYSRVGQHFQDNYPERLKAYFLINAPAYYVVGFNIIKRILDTEVIRKVRVFGRNGWKEELLKFIDADVLPAFLGGNRTDPDGNPMCNTFVCHGGRIPSKYHLSPEDRTFKDKSKVKHFHILPRTKNEIVIDVKNYGAVIELELEVASKDIGCGLYFAESHLTRREILPIHRIETLDGTGDIKHKCQWPGTYILVFDNTFSWINTKEVSYCITVKEPTE